MTSALMHAVRIDRVKPGVRKLVWGILIAGLGSVLGRSSVFTDVVGFALIIAGLAACNPSMRAIGRGWIPAACIAVAIVGLIWRVYGAMPSLPPPPKGLRSGVRLLEVSAEVAWCWGMATLLRRSHNLFEGRSWRITMLLLACCHGPFAVADLGMAAGGWTLPGWLRVSGPFTVLIVAMLALLLAPLFHFFISSYRTLQVGAARIRPCVRCGAERAGVSDSAACPGCGAAGQCIGCGYELTGLTGTSCPECGRELHTVGRATDVWVGGGGEPGPLPEARG